MLELREGNDLVEALADLGPPKTLDRTVQEDVLAAGEVRMEARTELEEGADPSLRADAAGRRPDDPRDHPKQSGLPRSVAPDQPDCFAARNCKRDVAERPDVLSTRVPPLDEEILEGARLAGMNAEAPRDAVYADLTGRHRGI